MKQLVTNATDVEQSRMTRDEIVSALADPATSLAKLDRIAEELKRIVLEGAGASLSVAYRVYGNWRA